MVLGGIMAEHRERDGDIFMWVIVAIPIGFGFVQGQWDRFTDVAIATGVTSYLPQSDVRTFELPLTLASQLSIIPGLNTRPPTDECTRMADMLTEVVEQLGPRQPTAPPPGYLIPAVAEAFDLAAGALRNLERTLNAIDGEHPADMSGLFTALDELRLGAKGKGKGK